jgi:hypothetical protein
MASNSYDSGRASVYISKVQILPGSESGKYDVTVTTKERGFTVEDKQGGMNASGQGHLHFYIDVEPPTEQGKPAIPAEGSVWAHVSSNTYTFTNVTPGKHTIYVELVNNDHTPLSPAVVVERTVNVS